MRGVPTSRVLSDHFRSAVSRVLGSRLRAENARWTALRPPFDMEAAYCLPGPA